MEIDYVVPTCYMSTLLHYATAASPQTKIKPKTVENTVLLKSWVLVGMRHTVAVAGDIFYHN